MLILFNPFLDQITASMESADSSTGGAQPPQLPPGFRFHPTDEELVVHYLKKKLASVPLPVSIIAEVDLYKFDPWELPARASFGEQEWYFFSPRDRKYPNGSRPNRSATSGYWKATGTDKPVISSTGNQKVGVKKSLVFYTGKPPKGIKTNWIMHEYRVIDNKSISKPPAYDAGQRGSLRLDEWVLCRIYKKTDTVSTTRQQVPMFFSACESPPSDYRQQSLPPLSVTDHEDLQQMQTSNYLAFLENEQNMFDHRMMSCSSGLLSQASMIGASSGVIPVKQALPTMYWNDENSSTTPSSAKRHLMDNCDENGLRTDVETNMMAGLLDQQAMLGSLADGTRINWYS